jgi:hypothetical protein
MLLGSSKSEDYPEYASSLVMDFHKGFLCILEKKNF